MRKSISLLAAGGLLALGTLGACASEKSDGGSDTKTP